MEALAGVGFVLQRGDGVITRESGFKWRGVGLRVRVPKKTPGVPPVAFAAMGLAEIYDVETGEGFNAKWDDLIVSFAPDGAVTATVKFFPQEFDVIEVEEG